MKKTILTISVALVMHCFTLAQVDEMFSSCLKCDLEGVKKAIENGADINAPNPTTKQNALAYSYMCPTVTRYLLEKKCDPNGGSYPAILGAASAASLEVLQLLLDNGADPNKSALNMNALIQVVKMSNCAACTGLLLNKGADKDAKESIYGNAMGVYAAYGIPQEERKDAMKKYGDILKGYGLAVPEWYYNPSSELNASPDEMVRVLVQHGIDINKRGTNVTDPSLPGEPPLFTAMNVGKQEIIMSFLNNGADYNAVYLPIEKGILIWDVEGGYTPLMYACVKGYSDVVKWLVQKPDLLTASVNGTTISESKMILRIHGLSAIYLAIMSGNMEIVKAIADTPMKWEDLELNALPGQKFAGNYGSKDRTYNFIVSKKSSLKYTPSLFADFLKYNEMADFLRSKGL